MLAYHSDLQHIKLELDMRGVRMANPANDVIELAIDELRRIYDSLNHNYDQVKIKILTFLGGGFALLSFLYAGGDLFIPNEPHGRIFYFAGLALILTAMVILFYALRPCTWYFPTEFKDLRKLDYKDKNSFLLYVKEEYLDSLIRNGESYELKQRLLNTATYQLIIGAIILVVLNQFGG